MIILQRENPLYAKIGFQMAIPESQPKFNNNRLSPTLAYLPEDSKKQRGAISNKKKERISVSIIP